MPETDFGPQPNVETPLKTTFYSVISLPLTEATALVIPCKFGQLKA